MSDDDEFTPKLGRIRSTKTRERKYLHRVLQGIARAGGRNTKAKRSRFDGSRIGRGSGVGRVLRHGGIRQRRVVVQARFVKLAGKGLQSAQRHLRYLQRDGVNRHGERSALYDKTNDEIDGRSFMEGGQGDRHQFRFIVSPEDGDQYQDLKPLIRRLMAQMEQDLGTQLEWVAADHFNTGHPHAHIVVRGKDDRGQNLVISREYISHGLRARAAELVSLDLGSRTDFEIDAALKREVEQERFTSLDRDLLKQVDPEGHVSANADHAFRQTLRAGRLRKLERLGLADEVARGQWTLAANLEATLRQMGERGDIIKTLHRELAGSGVPRDLSAYAIYDPNEQRQLLGRVMAHGLSDELNERRYLILDGVDGRAYFVDAGLIDPENLPQRNSIVAVIPVRVSIRPSDRSIAEIAAANDGTYSAVLHAQHDPYASPEFIRAHTRRLEALRRGGVDVKRANDGTWSISSAHLTEVETFERSATRAFPVQFEVKAHWPLEQLVTAQGATWLDRELVNGQQADWRDAGFGHDARDALERRRLWLLQNGLALENGDRTIYPTGMLGELQRRDLAHASKTLSAKLNLPYVEVKAAARVSGLYVEKIDLVSGRFAVIADPRAFMLVPWRPVIENQLGKQLSGIVREDGVSWTFGRQRGGPAIS